jgi:GT2 family glycosyltransferase
MPSRPIVPVRCLEAGAGAPNPSFLTTCLAPRSRVLARAGDAKIRSPFQDEEPDAMQVSAVIATYNRGRQLRGLLADLAAQTEVESLEVCVVDDGSTPGQAPALEGLRLPYPLRFARQENAGAARARNQGAQLAKGELLVILDDDMRVDPGFIAAHLGAHSAGPAVGLGRILPGAQVLPLFERWHAWQIEKLAEAFAEGERPRGIHLFSGNVSVRREDFLAVGGFDESLPNAEDSDLGLKLEARGLPFTYVADAVSRHESSHASLTSWCQRAVRYGRCYRTLARKHATARDASPWRLADEAHPALLPLIATSLLAPRIGRWLATPAYAAALGLSALGFEGMAQNGVTAAFSTSFFAGMTEAAGGTRQGLAELSDYAETFGVRPAARGLARLARALAPRNAAPAGER